MKVLFTSIFLGLFFTASAQNPRNAKDAPFQVIFAESVRNMQGKEVKSLDLVSIDDILTVRKGGFLSMINYFGFPVEIEGDTTITIANLQKAFDLLRGSPGHVYNSAGRPDIGYLFISDPELAQKRLERTGACSDCDFDLELVYPPHRGNVIFFTGDLCLIWHSTGSKNYVVNLSTMFDDPIESYKATTNELKIDSADITAMVNRNGVLLLTIEDHENRKFSHAGVIKKFPTDNGGVPYGCTTQKATYALIQAFYLENGPRDFPKLAGEYYRLAAESSDREFFRTMLDNFNKRKE